MLDECYTKYKYVDLDPDFKPLQKYGHLSEKKPEYTSIEAAIDAAYTPFAELPFPEVRAKTGDPDAVMPPGGPDRYQDVETKLLNIPARDGHMLELKVYKSPQVEPNATLMYRMHGGGWVVGSHEVDGVENVYAAATNRRIVVVSVDYRCAPEHPFPTPFNDCYDGLVWCKENASNLGIDPEKIIISGSSAGGNLAAALTIEARERGITGILAQVLHFPIICHPKFFPREQYEFGSYIQNRLNAVVGVASMERCLDAYIPDAQPDRRHSPLLAESHQDLPPTLIQCAGLDVLRDEALAYAEALNNAGVSVVSHVYKGLPHCFPVMLNDIQDTKDFYSRYTDFLAKYA